MFGRFDPQLNELHNLDCGLREPDFHLNRSARHEWRRNTPDSSPAGSIPSLQPAPHPPHASPPRRACRSPSPPAVSVRHFEALFPDPAELHIAAARPMNDIAGRFRRRKHCPVQHNAPLRITQNGMEIVGGLRPGLSCAKSTVMLTGRPNR